MTDFEIEQLIRTVTPEVARRVDELIAAHGGDPVAAYGRPLPADAAAEMRRVMAGAR